MEQYIRNHIAGNIYIDPIQSASAYQSRAGWVDHRIGPHLLYSHRRNDYTKATFDETLHFHEYYELVLYLRGDVDYVCGQSLLSPHPMAAVHFPPGELHNTRLNTPSHYERHVFYFREDAFRYGEKTYPLWDFLKRSATTAFEIPEQRQPELISLLARLEGTLSSATANGLLPFALTVELFSLLEECHTTAETDTTAALPARMLELKSYIDEHYASIRSVTDLAARLFYSREYISRLFRRYYNTSVAGYLARYRVRKSLSLLEKGFPVTQVAFDVGFGSMSAYISAFKKYMGIVPSAWHKK
ncbi:MAG: helix-turn-helix transcriptional regulator [Clostridia bacterium]|nr:helix-turn-helix transcriptional regulator [Clostridia bacterium]